MLALTFFRQLLLFYLTNTNGNYTSEVTILVNDLEIVANRKMRFTIKPCNLVIGAVIKHLGSIWSSCLC